MIEHTITLHGPGAGGGKPRPAAAAPLLSVLEPALRDNLRLAFFSSSRIKGRPSRPLQKAWAIRLAGLRAGQDGATVLVFEAPTLGEAAPALYDQRDLWDDAPGPDETALDLLGYTLADIGARLDTSNRFDLPLLRRIHQFRRALDHGVSRITISGQRRAPRRDIPAIEQPLIEAVGRLISTTPSPRRVRVQGVLDMVRCSDRVFEVETGGGERLRAVWTPMDLAPLKEYLNTGVLIEGDASFRPNGKVLRVDVDAIRPALPEDAFFSVLPRPEPNPAQAAHLPDRGSRANGGLASLAGAWPGDESAEELLATLADLGR
ncbi:MAG: hypothetical protein KF886_00890 [Candidatus Hydrogenedentes bacterium]|nr:hypothetical protein [Candidatus Hydrogenedentota bacterium]